MILYFPTDTLLWVLVFKFEDTKKYETFLFYLFIFLTLILTSRILFSSLLVCFSSFYSITLWILFFLSFTLLSDDLFYLCSWDLLKSIAFQPQSIFQMNRGRWYVLGWTLWWNHAVRNWPFACSKYVSGMNGRYLLNRIFFLSNGLFL